MTCSCNKKHEEHQKEREKCVMSVLDVIDDMSCGLKSRFEEGNQGIFKSTTHAALDSFIKFAKCKANDLIEKIVPGYVIE